MKGPSAVERRIVVGVDGSPASKVALRWAAHIARAEGASLDAVIAWEFPPALVGVGAMPPAYYPDVEADRQLTDAIDEVFGAARPTSLRPVVRRGRAVDVLLQLAKDAHLLVVGSRGRGAVTGALLGSVSARVAGHATCPVLVVPEAAALPSGTRSPRHAPAAVAG